MSTIDEKSSESWSPSDSTAAANPPVSGRGMWFVLVAGVVLPLLAIGFELATRTCTFFFDPFPTNWHLALLTLVPTSNALVLWTHRRAEQRLIPTATILLGIATGVSFAYSIVFLPMAPLSAIAILFAGLGLLGLSPYFSFASSLLAARRLRDIQTGSPKGRPLFWTGLAAGTLPILLYAFAGHMTMVGLDMAASEDEARSQRGVEIIRKYGSRQALLRACYELPADPWATIVEPWVRAPRDEARDIYYRVTGEPFNSVPPPRLAGPKTRLVEDVQFDADVGGTAVNGILRDVSLASSDAITKVDPDGLTVYTEWTMEFRNRSLTEREARAEIALPPGGVVSRVTLWVKGEEREAAFAGRGKVREAYEQVAVVQSRDPVLVTSSGPDRVLMQCFPIPPRGGKMMVRLGITSPLPPDGSDYVPPRFVERNFAASSNTDVPPVIRKGSGAQTAWTPDPVDPGRFAIVQSIRSSQARPPKTLAIVVDSSLKVGEVREEVAAALGKLPEGCRFTLISAGDQVTELIPLQPVTDQSRRAASEQIEKMRFVGGINNTRALLKAHDIAGSDGAIIWIHGPQPFSPDARTKRLQSLYRGNPNDAPFYAVVAADGRNSILADLEQTGVVKIQNLDELEQLFGRMGGEEKQLVAVRERVPLGQAVGTRVSRQLAMLWARDEVIKLCREGRTDQAIGFGSRYRIVTPVTGAVVLETDRQYKENGLEPPKVMATPEPSTWLALAVGAAFLGIGHARRRRRSSA